MWVSTALRLKASTERKKISKIKHHYLKIFSVVSSILKYNSGENKGKCVPDKKYICFLNTTVFSEENIYLCFHNNIRRQILFAPSTE